MKCAESLPLHDHGTHVETLACLLERGHEGQHHAIYHDHPQYPSQFVWASDSVTIAKENSDAARRS